LDQLRPTMTVILIFYQGYSAADANRK
jgi:hypothetical protein